MIEVYRAEVENVRCLKSKRKIINKMINNAIKRGSQDEIETLTILYAMLYSAFAETCFVKLINTPHGFKESEIKEIMKQKNLEEKWKKTFEIAFKKIESEKNKGDIANKKKKLRKILEEYIIEPSQIRNKVAHGQWKVCLNNGWTAENESTTKKINELDCVLIDKLYEIYRIFEQTIEDLIESPLKAHYQKYHLSLIELENYIDETSNWSFESKKEKLTVNNKKNKSLKFV